MAQKTIVQFTDDVDGGEASETVTFALDGVNYEIDLSADNATKLRAAVAPYQSAGRRQAAGARGNVRRNRSRDYDPKAVRAWAGAKGIDVPPRGRIPGVVIDQYRAAGN